MHSLKSKSFLDIQHWFGNTILQTMDEPCEDPHGYIVSTHSFSASERMQLYRQSYWLRLLSALREQFPFTTRLFGESDFDTLLGIPYLFECPPHHWSLNLLGDRFLLWLKNHYEGADKPLVTIAAGIDWACQESFFAPSKEPVPLQHPDTLFALAICLQPHLKLFHLPGDFFRYREEFLRQPPEYWLKSEFPQLHKEKSYSFALFRTQEFTISWEEIDFCEYQFLEGLKQGASIDHVAGILSYNEELIASWVQKWLLRQWLIPFANEQCAPQ